MDSAVGDEVVAAIVGRVHRGLFGNAVDSISTTKIEGEGHLLVLRVTARSRVGAAVVTLHQLQTHTHSGILLIVERDGGVLRIGEIQSHSVAAGVLALRLMKHIDGRRLFRKDGLSVHNLVTSGLALVTSVHILRDGQRIAAEVVNDARL